MKLISVQSRGNRLVRVILTEEYFIVYGKTTAYHREWGTTHTATALAGTGKKGEALKAAKQWLEGAAV